MTMGKIKIIKKIIHKRTRILDDNLSPRTHFYNFRKNAKFIRKPTEIIIFTDGFPLSAASAFIKKHSIKRWSNYCWI